MKAEYERRIREIPEDGRYSPSNPAYQFAIQSRWKIVLDLIKGQPNRLSENRRILEIGCGSGGVLEEYQQGFPGARLFGIDLLFDRLLEADELLPSVGFNNADGQALPFAQNTFDLVLQYTAFSSVLDPTIKKNMAHEMLRILKQDGAIIWYDFWWNPTNKQTRGIKPDEIQDAIPGMQLSVQENYIGTTDCQTNCSPLAPSGGFTGIIADF